MSIERAQTGRREPYEQDRVKPATQAARHSVPPHTRG